MKKTVLKWELLGIIFIFFLGALLHFVFEWSGNSKVVGLFTPVNESVWEHFKLGFWPMFLWALIEYRSLSIKKHFITAKAAAIYSAPIITALAFYTYTAIVGNEILIVDILIFALAVAISQLISYKILVSARLPVYVNIISLVFIVILALVLIIFTIYPPHFPIFLDHTSGTYGIP